MKIWDFSFSYWYKKHLKLFVWFGLCGRSLLVSACSPQFDLCKCRSLFFQMEVIIFSNGGHYFLTFGSGDKKHTSINVFLCSVIDISACHSKRFTRDDTPIPPLKRSRIDGTLF